MIRARRADLGVLALIVVLAGLGAWLLFTPAAPARPLPTAPAEATEPRPSPAAPESVPGPSTSPHPAPSPRPSQATTPASSGPVATQNPQEDLDAAQELLERSYPDALRGPDAAQSVDQAWAGLSADLLAAGVTDAIIDGATAVDRGSGRWVIVRWSGTARTGADLIGQLSSVQLSDGAVTQIVTGPPPSDLPSH